MTKHYLKYGCRFLTSTLLEELRIRLKKDGPHLNFAGSHNGKHKNFSGHLVLKRLPVLNLLPLPGGQMDKMITSKLPHVKWQP